VNLSDRGELIGFLRKHGLAPEKGLGQHFLCSSKVVDAIVGSIPAGASVLEIGPGPGILTRPMSQLHSVIALELDARMPLLLAESAPEARIVLGDALHVDLSDLLDALPAPRAVVSNLPYYITGPLLDRIARARSRWDIAILMMQREVGDKILAMPGDRMRGAISVRMQAEFTLKRVCSVPPGAFLPPPKVDSVVLQLTPQTCTLDDAFFEFVHKGFVQPRKTLANNLAASGYSKEAVEASGLAGAIRPHQVSQEEWENLYAQVI
jgi:16S rRNA (adenine1518-N6/adenine1519-N6)-dimethyltransferase